MASGTSGILIVKTRCHCFRNAMAGVEAGVAGLLALPIAAVGSGFVSAVVALGAVGQFLGITDVGDVVPPFLVLKNFEGPGGMDLMCHEGHVPFRHAGSVYGQIGVVALDAVFNEEATAVEDQVVVTLV